LQGRIDGIDAAYSTLWFPTTSIQSQVSADRP
jgi:hypothetical protein